ncbi:MAG: acetolactate synthase small subunit [Clostridiaceae bacterium]|nr:acetolactate synthase small subunit [Clostridiaceae bacterium]
MKETKMRVISILVENNAGTLARIASLFARRGYNIDSLTVSATKDAKISRLTVTAQLNDLEVEQLIAQTEKLQEVQEIEELFASSSVLREIMLIKIKVDNGNRSQIMEIASVYGGVVVDLSPESMILELTGKPAKIDAFIKMLQDFTVVDFCRTGVTGMARN